VLLLHGFPELAYSWRKTFLPLAAAGYHVVAPDQRGYGRTTGWDVRYDGDLAQFRMLNLAEDAASLVRALGRDSVAAVVGHDFGSPVAAWCALTRPEMFRAVVLMSATFGGPPGPAAPGKDRIHEDLAKLAPPRKHYQWYYSTRQADADMRHCRQGLHAFLRAYFHHKSADWKGNRPFALGAWSAAELARMPTYYIMALDRTMPETVAPEMPSAAEIAACDWLTDAELGVYAAEFARTGFQGGLQWYRCRTSGAFDEELRAYAGRKIEVPACFIAGASDWGPYQRPGDLEAMRTRACARLLGCHFVQGAGHWVQQEKPAQVSRLLVEFLA
jgi:pimeloyl-ACP methyl ester carboxylesterase